MESLHDQTVSQRNEHVDALQAILDRCASESRDLNAEESATADQLRSDIESCDKRIQILARDIDLIENAPKPKGRRQPDTQPDASAGGAPAVVTAQPGPYSGPHGFADQMRDLLGLTQPAGSVTDWDRDEAMTRSEEHAQWLASQHRLDMDRADIGMSSLPGLVVPQYDETMVSRGIYDSAVTLSRCRELPLPAVGNSIGLPRVSTKTSGAGLRKDNANTAESGFATSLITANIIEVAVDIPVSYRAIARGIMAEELIQSELLRGLNAALNELLLYGDANASSSEEPAGILLLGTGKTSTSIVHTDAAPSWRKIAGYVRSDFWTLWKALRMAPDTVIMSPKAAGGVTGLDDTSGRPIFDFTGAGRNVAGSAQPAPADGGLMPVAGIYGIPGFVDAQIVDTVAANNSSYSSGSETRIIIMRQDANPVAVGPVMQLSYDQTRADKGQILLIARREAAWNLSWRPEGLRVLEGTGLKVSGLSGAEFGDGVEIHPDQNHELARQAIENGDQPDDDDEE